ncbi:hypothetical protein LO762_02860 [Actinocorallia sp. API 0066]|uniref:hypothetical protein n=1 Tax=Actinocorallia sp. API 0066 TaxID=2896846 RepID=UPI001E30EA58|nr:hypothetical protein [Actinocorallia sp. API 0066]MCD0448141.1 hypothetical protein [Actinocorallia sp. API 0066]
MAIAPGGATVLSSPEDQRRIADLGAAVLDRLRADSEYQYDPAVVESLARVLDRRILR